MWLQTNRYLVYLITETRCHALFMINYKLARKKFYRKKNYVIRKQHYLYIERNSWRTNTQHAFGRVWKLTCFIKSLHCQTQKSQNANQLLNSTIPPLLIAPKEYHQHLMVAYQTLDFSTDAEFLYSKQHAKCQVPIL